MKEIVVGTHEYQWVLWPFSILFRKYWRKSGKITWYGDRVEDELPPNIEFKRVPCYTEGEWPWQHWFGNGLRSILEDIEDDIIALFLPDHWLTQRVNLHHVRKLERYMRSERNILRFELTAGVCLEAYGETEAWLGAAEVVSVPPTHKHCGLHGGVTFSPALWNRKMLIDLLESHWNLWDAERLGTEKMAREYPDWKSVGLRQGIVHRSHGMYHGQPGKVRVDGLSPGDAAMVKLNLPGGWSVAE